MPRSPRTATVLATAVATLLPVLSLAGPAHAAGTSYHVDNRPGSNCTDSGPATEQQPWCTFAPVNARTFTPGDRILLARGAQWAQGMTLTGSGTATDRIELSAYGSGAKPRILRGTATAGIQLTNVSHWTVKGLEIDGTSTGGGKLVYGIRADYNGSDGVGHEDLVFADLHLHHNHMGVYVAGNAAPASGQWALKGLTVTRVKGERNEASIATGANRLPRGFIQDAVFSHLELANDDGSPAVYKGCPNSMTLQNLTGVVVRDSLISHAGGCHVDSGTTGIYLGHVDHADIFNNIIAFTQQTASPDQSGVNYEGYTDDVAVRANLITGNVGYGVGLQGIHPDGPNLDATIESNAIVDNGRQPIASLGSAAPPTGTVRDNLWRGSSLTTTVSGGSFDGVTVTDNPGPVTGDRVWFAARDFATAQSLHNWTYQYSADAGATWKNLAYHQVDASWRPSGGSLPVVQKWNWHPGGSSTAYVARTWTAPRDGTVAIRGRAAKADPGGDGVRVRITRNGSEVLAPRTLGGDDRTGIPTDVDSLSVKAGDAIRFVVDPGAAGENSHDTTSWTPVTGYLN
ncbi:right-handed parallel beta-helix repeat-containing protein [Streptomyces sp. enrichment culture]|uniref:right-handed parallel beta-helix repeat-containing protein n=1 Tax=Streptomyces sp. enrichment culture TaxID=1795815 RepID=UPI003F569B82